MNTHMTTRLGLCLSLCAWLTACGGGSSSNDLAEQPATPTPVQEMTSLTIGVTDAEGDFIQYEVDLLSLHFVNARGDQVDVLPASARIDFAQYTDVTEILSVASVPTGVYTQATALVDFSAASIVTQDANGNVLPATALDSDGNPLGQLNIEINLSNFDSASEGFRLRAATPARFTLDFDLDASNQVTIDDAGTPDDISDDSASTQVAAVWIAEPLLDTEREHRIRGLLQGVDEIEASISLAIRPFLLRSGEFGSINLQLSDTAVYEIDQQSFTGEAGVSALAAMAQDTPLVASGHFVESAERFIVDTVFAGTSVPWAGGEFIKGVVTARDGNLVTVQGVRFTPSESAAQVSPELQFELTADTLVSYAGQPNTLADSAVSIGQRVRVYDAEVGGELVAEHVGLLKNQLRAKVSSVANGLVEAELSLFNGRRPAAYAWAQSEADPVAYRIMDKGLPHTLTAGDYLKARGWVSAYDFASGVALNPWDFEASTLIDLNVAARSTGLHIHWQAGATALTSANDQMLTVSLAEADKAVLSFAGFRESLMELEALSVVPATSDKALYSILVRGEPGIQLFFNFASMSAALTELTDAGHTLVGMSGGGRWSESDASFSTNRLVIMLNAAE